MGSIIQATPLLRALKAEFPSAKLTFLTAKANRDLVERLGYADQVLSIDDRSIVSLALSSARALCRLVSTKVDHYFDLEVYSGFACLLCLFSLARNRFGFCRHSTEFKEGIYTHLLFFNTRMAVRRLYMQLGRLAGTDSNSSDSLGTIEIADSECETAAAKLSALGLEAGEKYIVVNPNASDLLIERRWPREKVVRAVTLLAEAGQAVVLIGAPNEAAYVSQIWDLIPSSARSRVFNSAGCLSLGEVLATIKSAACVLTNDTGPMHFAFALGRPTVCLFGPQDPRHYGMDGPSIVTLYQPVSCSPCIHEIDEPPCRGNNVCMQRHDPDSVVGEVLAMLGLVKSQPRRSSSHLTWDSPDGEPLGAPVRASRPGKG